MSGAQGVALGRQGSLAGGLAGPPSARLRLSAPRSLGTWGWRLLSFAIVFALWEIAGRAPVSLAFPPISKVALALVELAASGDLARAYSNTLPPLLIGLAVVSVGGVVAGIAMGLSRGVEWFLLPVLVILQTAPVAAIIPLLTFFYGVSAGSKVGAVILLSAPLVALNSYRGVRSTNTSLLDMCRAFLGTRMQQITKIMIPYASGMIFAGLRLGISAGFIGIVLAELLITPTGIGDLISYSRSIARYDQMFAAILSIIVLATVTLALLEAVERRLFRPEQATLG